MRVGIAFLLVVAVGCAGRRATPRYAVTAPLALAPCENLSGDPRAPEILGGLLDGALRTGRIEVVGSITVPRNRLPTLSEVGDAAAREGASFALLCKVIQYERRPEPRGGDVAIVALDVRLLEVASKRVVWQDVVTASSRGVMNPGREGLSSVSLTVVRRVAEALAPEGPR